MVHADVPQVAALLRRYLARFEIFQTFAKDDEVEHWFLSGQGRGEGDGARRPEQVVWAYVVEVSISELEGDRLTIRTRRPISSPT